MSRTKVIPFSPKLDIDYDALPHSMAGPYLIAKPGRKRGSYTGLRWKFKVPQRIDPDVFSKDAVVIDFTKREDMETHISEKKPPKKGTPEYHQYKIAVDTVKNPLKGKFMGGPTEKEAIGTLKRVFGYSDSDIRKLQKESREDVEEAKRRSPKHEFDNGVELVSYGMSPKGNHTVTFVTPRGKKHTVQTNRPGLPHTHKTLRGPWKQILRDDDVEKVGEELLAYAKKHLGENALMGKKTLSEFLEDLDESRLSENVKHRFEKGKTYRGRSMVDYDTTIDVTIKSRTDKTVTVSTKDWPNVDGKKFKIHTDDVNSTEMIRLARYSMAPWISADRLVK